MLVNHRRITKEKWLLTNSRGGLDSKQKPEQSEFQVPSLLTMMTAFMS